MKAVVSRVARTISMTIEEVDISGDPELEKLYDLEIPVLMIDGKKAAKIRVTEDALRRLIVGRR